MVVGLAADGDVALPDLELGDGPLVVVIGSEGKGLSRLVAETCDQLVSIPMSTGLESLNAGVAAGIALYAIAQSRSLTAQPSTRSRYGLVKRPLGVGLVADRHEVVEPGVPLAQVGGVDGVHLAPVRAALVGGEDLLGGGEVGRRVAADVLVHGDVAVVALVPGRHPHVVGAGEAHLDREGHRLVPGVEPGLEAAMTSGSASRGIANSDSRNRTRRGDTNTS